MNAYNCNKYSVQMYRYKRQRNLSRFMYRISLDERSFLFLRNLKHDYECKVSQKPRILRRKKKQEDLLNEIDVCLII